LRSNPGVSNTIDEKTFEMSSLSQDVLIPLQMPPDSIESNSLAKLMETHDSLKNCFIGVSGKIKDFVMLAEDFERKHALKEELFNQIIMDWAQLTEDLYIMAKFSEPFGVMAMGSWDHSNARLELTIPIFPFNLKTLVSSTVEESEKKCLEFYQETFERAEECIHNMDLLKSPLQRILSGKGSKISNIMISYHYQFECSIRLIYVICKCRYM